MFRLAHGFDVTEVILTKSDWSVGVACVVGALYSGFLINDDT